jgi:hypothetical protein
MKPTSYYYQAFSKNSYVDPIGKVITALSLNLQIFPNTSLSPVGNVVDYEFPDGWSGAAPTYSVLENGDNTTATELGYWQQSNTEFETVMNVLYPGIAFIACGLTFAPAVFTQNIALSMSVNGQISTSNADSKSGGCSGLVHLDTWSGWGVAP